MVTASTVKTFGPEWGEELSKYPSYMPLAKTEIDASGNWYAPFEDTSSRGLVYRFGLLVRSAATGKVHVYWDGGLAE